MARPSPRHGGAARRPRRDRRARAGRAGAAVRRQGAGAQVARGTVPSAAAGRSPRTSGRGDVAVLFGTPDGPTGYCGVAEIDEANGEVVLVWNDKAAELGVHPRAVALHDWVQPNPKPAALDELAAGVLAVPGSRVPTPASLSLLRRDDPRFTPGGGPPGGVFTDDLDAMCGWVRHLDGSCVSIQGPPGTGKTYWGAHLVHGLVGAGRRVGITAMSHHAIDNLLEEILAVFGEKGDLSGLDGGAQGARRHLPQTCRRHLRHRQCPLRQERLQPGRRHHVGVRRPRPGRCPGRRADRRRGRTTGPGRCARRLDVGQERRPPGRSAPTPAGGAGPASRGRGVERPAARAGGRRDDAAGSRGLPDRDQAHAPRRVPVHLGGDLRGAAREPSGLRPAGNRVRDRACAGSEPTTTGARPSPSRRRSSWPARCDDCWAPRGWTATG